MSGPTCVHVEVKGSLDIPLNLGLLADLADPIIEQEVIREAVRIAVSERLGYFDDIDVRLSSSGGREGCPSAATTNGANASRGNGTAATLSSPTRGRRYCEATVNLVQLGHCIEAIQKAYERLLAHAQLLHDVLNGPTPTPGGPTDCEDEAGDAAAAPRGNAVRTPATSSVAPSLSSATDAHAASTPFSAPQGVGVAEALERLAAARQLAAEMVAEHRADVVAAAVASTDFAMGSSGPPNRGVARAAGIMEEEQAMMDAAVAARRAERQGRRRWSSCGEEEADDNVEEQNVDAGLRYGLLACDDDTANHDAGGHGRRDEAAGEDTSESPQPEDDDADEEQLRLRYMRLGYAPL